MVQFTQHPFKLTATFGKLPGLLLLCSLAVACTQAAPTLSPTPPSTDTIAPMQTASPIPASETLAATPLPTVTPTDTLTSTPIPTSTAISTLHPLPIMQINKICITPDVALSSDFLTEGTIFISKYSGYQTPAPSMYAISKQEPVLRELKDLPPFYYTFDVSPNGQYALYSTQNANRNESAGLLITGNSGIVKETIDCDQGWLSNEYVLCKGLNSSDVVPAGFTEFTFELLNPFTSEFQNVPVKLPRVYIEPDESVPFYPVLDTSLTKLIYVEGVLGGVKTLSLWDIPSEKALWELEVKYSLIHPIWSPDGKQLAVDISGFEEYNLFIVDADGNAQQWIHFDDDNVNYNSINSDDISWSPNGRYLAMVVAYHHPTEDTSRTIYTLFVLDTWTRQLTDFCGVDYTLTLHWSPDSTQLVTENPHDDSIVVDIVKERVTKLGMPSSSYRVLGWVATQNLPTPTASPR